MYNAWLCKFAMMLLCFFYKCMYFDYVLLNMTEKINIVLFCKNPTPFYFIK